MVQQARTRYGGMEASLRFRKHLLKVWSTTHGKLVDGSWAASKNKPDLLDLWRESPL